MDSKEKIKQLFVLFIVTSIIYTAIQLFFKYVKVTQFVSHQKQKEELIEGLPFGGVFMGIGSSILTPLKDLSKYNLEQLGQGFVGCLCCFVLPIYIWWKFVKK